MTNTTHGWTCGGCGGWVEPATEHYCLPQIPYHPCRTYFVNTDPMDRIAAALERMAAALERKAGTTSE